MKSDPFDTRSPFERVAEMRHQRNLDAVASYLFVAAIPITLAFALMWLLRPAWQTAAVLGATALSLPVVWWARYLGTHGRPRLGGYLMTTYLLVMADINGVLIEGLFPAVAPAFAPIIIIAGMVLGPSGGLTIAVVASFLWAAGWGISTADLIPSVVPSSTLLVVVVGVIIAAGFLFTAFTSWVATRDLQRALDEATFNVVQSNQQLETINLELRRAKNRAEAILSSSPNPILLLRSNGTISTGNPSFDSFFGYRGDELYGQSVLGLIDPAQAKRVNEALRDVVVTLETEQLQVTARRKDGSSFDAGLALAPILDEEVVKGIVCSIHDISAIKEVERMKDAFVSNVSHELRTPITSIKLYHELLSRSPQRNDIYMDHLGREVDRLKDLIEDLLRLSRLDQGQVEMDAAPLSLNELAAQYVDDRRLLAEQRGLELRYVEQPDLPTIRGDAGMLGQVLSILLTNALNYTPAGGSVTVRTCTDGPDRQHRVGFSVSDTGPGISPEDRQRLFERFFRGTAGRASRHPGTGLGLAIAREIVLLHRGAIEVASSGVPGEGATFAVWFSTDTG